MKIRKIIFLMLALCSTGMMTVQPYSVMALENTGAQNRIEFSTISDEFGVEHDAKQLKYDGKLAIDHLAFKLDRSYDHPKGVGQENTLFVENGVLDLNNIEDGSYTISVLNPWRSKIQWNESSIYELPFTVSSGQVHFTRALSTDDLDVALNLWSVSAPIEAIERDDNGQEQRMNLFGFIDFGLFHNNQLIRTTKEDCVANELNLNCLFKNLNPFKTYELRQLDVNQSDYELNRYAARFHELDAYLKHSFDRLSLGKKGLDFTFDATKWTAKQGDFTSNVIRIGSKVSIKLNTVNNDEIGLDDIQFELTRHGERINVPMEIIHNTLIIRKLAPGNYQLKQKNRDGFGYNSNSWKNTRDITVLNTGEVSGDSSDSISLNKFIQAFKIQINDGKEIRELKDSEVKSVSGKINGGDAHVEIQNGVVWVEINGDASGNVEVELLNADHYSSSEIENGKITRDLIVYSGKNLIENESIILNQIKSSSEDTETQEEKEARERKEAEEKAQKEQEEKEKLENANKDSIIEDLKQELTEAEEKLRQKDLEAVTEDENHKLEVEEYQNRITELEARNHDLVEANLVQVENKNKEIEQLEKEASDLETSNLQLIDELQKRITTLESLNTRLQDEANLDVENKNKDIEALKVEIESLENQLKSLEQTNGSISDNTNAIIEAKNKEIDKLKSDNTLKEQTHIEVLKVKEGIINELKDSNQKLMDLHKNDQTTLKALEDKINSLESEKIAFLEIEKAYQDEIQRLNAKADASQEAMKALEAELLALKEKNSEANTEEIQKLVEDNRKLDQQRINLQSLLDASRKAYENYKEEADRKNARLGEDLDNLKKNYSRDLDQLSQQLKKLEETQTPEETSVEEHFPDQKLEVQKPKKQVSVEKVEAAEFNPKKEIQDDENVASIKQQNTNLEGTQEVSEQVVLPSTGKKTFLVWGGMTTLLGSVLVFMTKKKHRS